MSIQWVIIAGFLYFQMGIIVLFLIPIIPVRKWDKLFKSRFLLIMSRRVYWYFGCLCFFVCLLLLDAFREMRKYMNMEGHEHEHLENELQRSMKMFRAQRNFYISFISLFFIFVIRRFVQLISKQHELMAESEASMKQAKSATAAARSFLQEAGESAQNSSNEAHQIELNKLTEEIELLKKEIEVLKKDKEAVISQAKSVEHEYDRLNEEHRKLQLKVQFDDTKKDD